MKIYIKTFGCSSNRADSAAIAELLKSRHFELAATLQEAEAVIVNTCTVRKETELKVLRFIDELAGKVVVVTGCMAEAQPALIARHAPGASIVSPYCLTSIPRLLQGGAREVVLARESPLEPAPFRTGLRYTVPISSGCLGACTYCVVKMVRGGLRSLPPGGVIDLVSCAVRGGVHELFLSAQDTCAYGKDLQSDLPALLDMISEVKGDFRVRVGMFNPSSAGTMLERLVKSFSADKIYKFIHVPVQSGSDMMLQSMNRCYGARDFKKVISAFRKPFPDIAVFTDIIVGFPGETEDDFSQTCDIIKEVRPAKTHIARYSPRPHTTAASMRQIPEGIKKARSDSLALLVKGIQAENNSRWVGRILNAMIVDEYLHGGMIARTDEYRTVAISDCSQSLLGSHVRVEVESFTPYYLLGRISRR